MRLASYQLRGRPSFGVIAGEGIVDLRLRLSRFATLLEVFRAQALGEARAAAAGVRPDVPLAEVELLAAASSTGKNPLRRASITPTANGITLSPSRRNIRACSFARRIRWSATGKS